MDDRVHVCRQLSWALYSRSPQKGESKSNDEPVKLTMLVWSAYFKLALDNDY